jgi:lysophospholipase L1-like esterase
VQRLRRHLHQQNVHTTDNFADSFGFSGESVFVSGVSGLCVNTTGLNFIRSNVERFQPHLLVLEIGTNDLTNNLTAHQLARTVIQFNEELLITTSVRLIVLCQIVNRRRTRRCPIVEFDQHRLTYNQLIQQEARRNRRIYVYRHDRSILVNLSSRISSDDIHATSSQGLRLYHLSIRRAITIGMRRVSEL